MGSIGASRGTSGATTTQSENTYNKGELSASVINDLKENDFWGGRGVIIETTNAWNTNPDKMAPEDNVTDRYYSVELGPKASRDAELIRKLTRLGFEKTGERRYRRFISRRYGV